MHEEDIRDEEPMPLADEFEEADDNFLDDLDDDDLLGSMDEDELVVDDEDDFVQADDAIGRRSRTGLTGYISPRAWAIKTDVDIVLVIDCTGSMAPLLDKVKETALSFHDQVRDALGKKSRRVRRMRVKVIAYRDYYCDWADPEHPPMCISDFFELPDESEAFAEFVNSLEASGGEDEPESALEALHHAFNSEWLVDPAIWKRRQVIVLFTDAPAHRLDDPRRYISAEHNGEYPEEGMPTTLEELEAEYCSPDVFPAEANGMSVYGHCLLLFAPDDVYPWNKIQTWVTTNCESMDPENGLENIDMEVVIDLISGSC